MDKDNRNWVWERLLQEMIALEPEPHAVAPVESSVSPATAESNEPKTPNSLDLHLADIEGSAGEDSDGDGSFSWEAACRAELASSYPSALPAVFKETFSMTRLQQSVKYNTLVWWIEQLEMHA